MAKATESRHGINPLAGFNNVAVINVEPMLQAGNRLLEAWMVMTTEILEMSRARIDRSIEMSRAIAKSGSLNEAIDLQAKFAQEMMQDYVASANKLADLGARSLADGIGQLRAPANAVGHVRVTRAAAE
ncbi:MAG TPA: phasin family protein [Stellaceae bacterium]|jgi:phasin family protein